MQLRKKVMKISKLKKYEPKIKATKKILKLKD